MAKAKKTKKTSDAKGRRIFSFSAKILLLCLVPMLIICGLITFFSRQALTSTVENEIESSLKLVATSLDETYSNLYDGEFTVGQSGQVRKGDVVISKDTDLIDALKERTGCEMTLYFSERRLLTTLRRENGAPATGTSADPAVYKQILAGKTVFQSDVDLYGKKYYVLFQPLVNEDKSIPGGIAVAQEASSVQKTITAQTTRITLISMVLLVLMGVIIALLASRMVRVMKSTKEYLASLAKGELSVQPEKRYLSRGDEIGDIYQSSVQLQNELRKIVDNIKNSSSHMTSSADQLSDIALGTRGSVDSVRLSMDEVTRGSVTQAEETLSAIDNINRISEEITYITDKMDSLTEHAHQMANAEKSTEKIIDSLNNSNEETIIKIDDVSVQIEALHSSVESIRSAITMIQSIAEETDLLSLNANIEASKAGDAGRGFGVVATQINKLAEQSTNTAEEVEKIIIGITADADLMVHKMGELKERILKQQTQLAETMKQSSMVALGVNNSLDEIKTIRDNVHVLSQSGDAIQNIVHGLSSISEENEAATQSTMDNVVGMSSTMDTLENSSENLKTLAEELNITLGVFKM